MRLNVIMLMLSIKTPKQVRTSIAEWFRQQRILKKFTQQELAERSGVALSTLRLFERSGQISLERLLKVALVLGALDRFEGLFTKTQDHFDSIDDVEQMGRKRVVHRKKMVRLEKVFPNGPVQDSRQIMDHERGDT